MSESIVTPSQLGRYTLLGRIGAGGMAEVHLARSRGAGGTEKVLVIKKIHPALARNERFIDMFVEEARVAMRLNHSNIVQVYAFEKIDAHYVLAMEHVDGCDLHEIQTLAYEEGHRIPFGLCAFIAAEIAKGLEYAHLRRDEQGNPLELVHRDVSPQNVLISRDGAVKVTDFGIVKARYVNEKPGEVKGKLGYMSPEQAQGLPVDRRADIYSLGVVLHELLVGVTAARPAIGEVVKLAPPIDIEPTVPQALNDVTVRALQHDLESRYATARDMAADLRAYLHQEEDIYDAHTLETWISDTIPKERMQKIDVDAATVVTDATTRVMERTTQEHDWSDSESKPVVLVTLVPSIAPHPQRAAVLQEFHHLTEEIAYKSRGIFRRDDHALRVYFGLPVSALEDAISAIRLAIDMVDVVKTLAEDHRLTMTVRVAVTRGLARVSKRSEPGFVMFEPDPTLVQDAQRLIEICPPSEIVTCGPVYRLARTDYNFDAPQVLPREAPDEEDGVEPLLGHRVLGVKSRGERQHVTPQDNLAFVGREREMERLHEAYRRAMTGRPTLLKISGDLGLGKTRIVRHFLERMQGDGARIIRVESLFAERDQPLATTMELLRNLLFVAEHSAALDLRKVLQPLFAGAPHYLARQDAFFTRVVADPLGLWSRPLDNPRAMIRKLAFAVGVLLAHIAKERGEKRGVVLVVDNAQWMDGPSVDILAELASSLLATPVLAIFIGPHKTFQGRRIENLDRLEVGELPEAVMRQIIASRLGQGADIEEITQLILERSHGNPFFAAELIDTLIERGILQEVTRDGSGAPAYRQARPGPIRLPATMEGIAAGRIDSLATPLRTVLRAAAAIGFDFTEKTLESTLGKAVQSEVAELVRLGFFVLLPNAQNAMPRYRFNKAMEREAAYAGLSRDDKITIHQTEARRLILLHAENHPIPHDRIAWHLERSEQTEHAAHYYLEAARHALRAYSNRRALRLIERALAIMPSGAPQRYQALVIKERVLRDLGMHNVHLDTIREMEALGHLFDDSRMLAKANYRFARYEFDNGSFDESAAKLVVALRYARGAQDRETQVESLRALGYVCIEKGKLNRAMDCCRWALSLLDDSEDDRYLKARILGFQGLVLMEMGRIGAAALPLAMSMVFFRRLSDRRNESTQLKNLGLLAQAQGNLIESIDFLEHAVDIDRQIRDISERGRKLVACADVRIEMGDFERGRMLLTDALRICRNNYEPVGEVEAEFGMAQLLLESGDPAEAQELLLQLLDNHIVADSRMSLMRHRQLLAAACIQNGDLVRGLKAAEEATIMAQTSQTEAEVVHGAALRGLALAFLGRSVEALAATDLLEDKIGDLHIIRQLETIWWRRAHTLHLCEDFQGAQRALSRAREAIAHKASFFETPKHRALFQEHPRVQCILSENPFQSCRIA